MGLGTAFFRLAAEDLSEVAPELERRLREEGFNDVIDLVRPKAQVQFEGWDNSCWQLPGTLELLSHQYGQRHPVLAFLRTDATRAEWEAHLARLPANVRPVAHCFDLTLLTADERAALRVAYDAAEADGWSRVRSDHFALSVEELPFLFDGSEHQGIDVLIQEGDGERTWSSLDEYPQTRDADAEPPSVLEDRGAPLRSEPKVAAANVAARVADGVVGGVGLAVSAVYFSLCALVPLLAYPALLPDMLRSGDWGATLFTMGLLAAIGLLPLLLVWRRLGLKWRLAVFVAHALGVVAGVARFTAH